MEAEFLQFVADRLDRGDIELQPDPVADDLGLLEHFRHFPAQPLKQAEGGQRTCIGCIHGYGRKAKGDWCIAKLTFAITPPTITTLTLNPLRIFGIGKANLLIA